MKAAAQLFPVEPDGAPEDHPRPLSPAERMRRHRERQRQGRAVFRIEADEIALAELLVRLGALHPDAADDRETIAAAFQEIMDEWLTRYA